MTTAVRNDETADVFIAVQCDCSEVHHCPQGRTAVRCRILKKPAEPTHVVEKLKDAVIAAEWWLSTYPDSDAMRERLRRVVDEVSA